jgi:hypothetical protein
VHTPATSNMSGTDVPDIHGDIPMVERDIPRPAYTEAMIRKEDHEGISASDTLPDASMQPEGSGSRREVKVDKSTVVSDAHPHNYATRRPACRATCVDSCMSLPGVDRGHSRQAPPGASNVSLVRVLGSSPVVVHRQSQTP